MNEPRKQFSRPRPLTQQEIDALLRDAAATSTAMKGLLRDKANVTE